MPLTDTPVEDLFPGPADEDAYGEFTARRNTVMGHVNAAAHQLVVLTQDAIRFNWWRAAECRSPEHYLQACAGLDGTRARRIVRIARALVDWPALTRQFERGLVTEAAVDIVVTDCWHAHDTLLASAVGNWNIAQLHKMKRWFPKPPASAPAPASETEGEPEAETGSGSTAAAPVDTGSWGWDDDGRFKGRFDLGPALGAVAQAALDAARRALHRERTGTDIDDPDHPGGPITNTDVLERTFHAALGALDPATTNGHRPSDRYQAIIHLDAQHPERSRINLGPLLDRATLDEITCDRDLRALLHKGSRPVDWGRRKRLVDPLLRALVEDRDHGCRICGATGFLNIHHHVHWTNGGPTDTWNLYALCGHCHRAVHAGRINVVGTDADDLDGLRFLDRHHRPLPRPAPTEPDPDNGPGPPGEPYAPIRGVIKYSTIGPAPLPPPEHRDEYWTFN